MKRFFKKESGQTMVETALVLPVMLIVLMGILDFGWLFYNQMALLNAAREGARYAAVNYSAQNESQSKTDVQNAINSLAPVAISNFNVDSELVTYSGNKEFVKVTVSGDAPVFTPIGSIFSNGSTKGLSSSVTMYWEKQDG